MDVPWTDGTDSPDTRCGYVALVGRPNVGKSTLLNALLGERLSIVTPRAQTTRERVMGIETTSTTQIIFVDTPGILEPRYLLQQSMLDAARVALEDADLVLLLLDATRPDDTMPTGDALDWLASRRDALYLAINKVDAATDEAIDRIESWCVDVFDRGPFRISAVQGEGVARLHASLIDALPRSPFLYPPDEIATQPVRFFVAEFIRETIFELYQEEIPYSTVVRIDEFREQETPVFIRAAIHVERNSQKGILIGRGGTAIKELGMRAREKVEAFVGRPVYLDLWVKVLPKWRKRREALEYLGYALPPDARSGRKPDR